MAIVYSSGGVIVNNTFTATNKVDIVDNLKTNCVNAGWSVISGASGDWILESLATSQGLKHRIRMYDPGGGTNSARLNMRRGALTGTSDAFLYPDAATWRVIAHPYAFYIMHDAAPTANKRDFACTASLYIPSFLSVPSESCFLASHSLSDSSSASTQSFRGTMAMHPYNNNGLYCTMYNGVMFNSSTYESDDGSLRFRCGGLGAANGASINSGSCSTFADGTIVMVTPYVAWGINNSADVATINGILHDALIVEKEYNYGTTKTIDGKSWFAVTHNSSGNSLEARVAGTLFVRIT